MTVSGVSAASALTARTVSSGAARANPAASQPFDLNSFVLSTGISADAAESFLTGATRLSVASTDAGGLISAAAALSHAKVPMTTEGLPDFDAIVAAGGHVQGAIPPDGSPMIQNVTQNGNVTEYAAIIDMGDGSAPFLLKGGDSQAAAGTTQSDREQLLTTLKSVLADLPSSLEQARAWATANAWSPYGAEEEAAPSRRLDATA